MLVFITSLRHPLNCHSYNQVLTLLDLSLTSVCAQTFSDFRVVVVCNRAPNKEYPAPIDFVEVNFPPPSLNIKTPVTGMPAIQLDRGSKYMVGVSHALQYKPSHVMFFDADDLVSNRLSEFVSIQGDQKAWFFPTGYQIKYGSTCYQTVDNFYRKCGTSAIHLVDALEVDDSIHVDMELDELIANTDSYRLNFLFGSHRYVKRHYEQRTSLSINPLPFPGAIWVLGTGENHSGRIGKHTGNPVTSEIAREFAIPQTWLNFST